LCTCSHILLSQIYSPFLKKKVTNLGCFPGTIKVLVMKDIYISFWISYQTNLCFEYFYWLSNKHASAKVGNFSVGGELSPSPWNIWVFQIVRFNFGSFPSVKVSSVECWCKNIRNGEQANVHLGHSFCRLISVPSVVSQLAVGFGPQLKGARYQSKLRIPTRVIVLCWNQTFLEIIDHIILSRYRKWSTFRGWNVCVKRISDETYEKSVN